MSNSITRMKNNEHIKQLKKPFSQRLAWYFHVTHVRKSSSTSVISEILKRVSHLRVQRIRCQDLKVLQRCNRQFEQALHTITPIVWWIYRQVKLKRQPSMVPGGPQNLQRCNYKRSRCLVADSSPGFRSPLSWRVIPIKAFWGPPWCCFSFIWTVNRLPHSVQDYN